MPQYVTFLDGERTVVDAATPVGISTTATIGGHAGSSAHKTLEERAESARQAGDAQDPDTRRDWGPTARLPLGRLLGTRSGDKGGNANLGVFARSQEAFAWLDEFLTVSRLRELLPETGALAIDRHRLSNIWSLNFVIHGLLGEGVAASERQDPQAKSLGEWLRSRQVDLPVELTVDL